MGYSGKTFLGIELGSTRIKAVLIDEHHEVIASGGYDWENKLSNGYWTYDLADVTSGLAACYAALAETYRTKYGQPLTAVSHIGISAMMHGYLPFDSGGKQLAAFRTWRNTTTSQAADALYELFGFSIPQRWSVAHLYQAILNGEAHVRDIAHLTTLSGYVHFLLTGRRVLGVGDAAGMFPIDSATGDFSAGMIEKFDRLDHGMPWCLRDILPTVLCAGGDAGVLTPEGARLLDASGDLQAGIPLCPPEGDAGTGMVATNSVAAGTGNISAGTSIFAMLALERELSQPHREIDMVTTPAGNPVALVHCNNCTGDIDAWVELLGEAAAAMGAAFTKPALYDMFYHAALSGESDCGGLVAYNYFAGEHLTGIANGRPLLARLPDSRLSLANLTRTLLFSSMATMRIGMDILTEHEGVHINQLLGHGGLFKTEGVGQRLMAAALNIPTTVMQSAGEGGAWGIALLAAYAADDSGISLGDYLDNRVFGGNTGTRVEPDAADVAGFNRFIERYIAGLNIERAAGEWL